MVADILQEPKLIAVCETVHGCLCLSALRCFPGSSLGLSNHSVTGTRRRFPPGRPDDDPLLLALTNGDFAFVEKASITVSDPATDCVERVNVKVTSVLLEYPSPYSTMADRLFTPASVPFCCSVTFRL